MKREKKLKPTFREMIKRLSDPKVAQQIARAIDRAATDARN